MLITLSGLDGAGKTTLIEWLRTRLEAERRGVAVLHMAHDVGVYAYARKMRDRLQGLLARSNGRRARATSPSAATQALGGSRGGVVITLRRLRNAIVWSKSLRRLVYPVDLVLFLCYRAYIEGMTQRVLIMDRYFYDTLVDIADGRRWSWVHWLQRITPTPTVPVLLDIGPEESHARKGEYSLEYLRERWVSYQTVFPWVRAGIRLPNNDLATAKAVLGKAVFERLGVR